MSIRLYSLRKYFRNNIRVSDIGFREFWMGHTLGTDEHYRTRDSERHREEYAKAYESIRICTPNIPETIEELRAFYEDKIDKLERKIAKIQPLVEFVNSFNSPEELKRIFDFLEDDSMIQSSYDPRIKFDKLTADEVNKIAESKGITQAEALDELVKEGWENFLKGDEKRKKLTRAHGLPVTREELEEQKRKHLRKTTKNRG